MSWGFRLSRYCLAYSMPRITILPDVKALIKGRQVDGNRADTVRKYIEEHYPVFVKQENVSILDDVFSQFSDKLSKTEIEKIAKKINEIAKSKIDGSSSTDA